LPPDHDHVWAVAGLDEDNLDCVAGFVDGAAGEWRRGMIGQGGLLSRGVLRAEDVKENELCYKEGFRLLSSYPNMSAGGSPPHEDEDAHGDQGVQYCAPLGQRG
jgi:hypothetical protein